MRCGGRIVSFAVLCWPRKLGTHGRRVVGGLRMLKRLMACWLIGQFAASAVLAQPDLTSGNYWGRTCRSADATDQISCAAFVLGAINGVEAGEALQKMAGGKRLWCIPPGVTAEQHKDIALRYLDQHPEHRHWSFALIVVLSGMDFFPCAEKRLRP